MKVIVRFIQRIIMQDQIKMLGRWKIIYNRPVINKKIDLANEDHCGVCYSTKYHNIKLLSINKNPIIDLE
jgi:hypothetical protein